MNFSDAFDQLREGQRVTTPDRSLTLTWDRKKDTLVIIPANGLSYDIRQTESVEDTFVALLRDDWQLNALPQRIEKEETVEQPQWWEQVNFSPDQPSMVRLGDTGDLVKNVQQSLKERGFNLEDDGVFGPETDRAVRAFQRANGLVSDGIVGEKTIAAFSGEVDKKLTVNDKDIEWAAHTLQCDVAAILAVSEVESSGSGFFSNGKAKILFERHWMRRRLAHHGIDYKPFMRAHPNVVNNRAGGYKGGLAEYARLEQAQLIHKDSALESASWGAYQIMGFHWENLDYDSPEHFTTMMQTSELEHLKAFVFFNKKDPVLLNALQNKAWATYARRYNGPAHKRYDQKIAAAYARHQNAANA